MNWSEALSKAKLRCPLLVLAASVVLGLPILLYGPLPTGHDLYEHINLSRHFAEQFRTGELYPRWLIDMNHGLGSPTYFVFPPFSTYLYLMLKVPAHVLHFNAFTLGVFLPLLASGLGAFLWMRTMTRDSIAAAIAVFYMVAPYHFVIDTYIRGAISECWGFVWMPVILYFVVELIAGKRWAFAGLALASAMMIFSHLISLAMFLPVPFALAVIQPAAGKRLRSLILVATSMLLGAGISGVYLIPALDNSRIISGARFVAFPFYQPSNHFLYFGRQLFGHYATGGTEEFLQICSWGMFAMILVFAICGFVAWSTGPRESRRIVLLWIALCCWPIFLLSPLSNSLWLSFHRLHEAVEFPWRYGTQLGLAVLPLIAIAFSRPWKDWPLPRAITLSAALLVCGMCLGGYGLVWSRYFTPPQPSQPPSERHLISDADVLLKAWLPDGMNQRSTLVALTQPRIRFKEGSGEVQETQWKPRHIEFQTNSATGGWVEINQLHYPTWTAATAATGSEARAIPIQAAMPEGLIEVQVPPGTQDIHLEIPVSASERWGRWISLLSVCLCLLTLRKARSKPAGVVLQIDRPLKEVAV